LTVKLQSIVKEHYKNKFVVKNSSKTLICVHKQVVPWCNASSRKHMEIIYFNYATCHMKLIH